MKNFLLLFTLLCSALFVYTQTNPTALTLPASQNFGTAAFSTPFAGMASWKGDAGGTPPYVTQATAEASQPGSDQTITLGEPPAAAPPGGQYGGAVSGNARLHIVQSGNAASGTTQVGMAINTTGATNVNVAYDLTMTIVNTRDIGIALQYRIGTSGAFTTVAGSAVVYSNSSTNGGDTDGSTDSDSYTYVLPAAVVGQAMVQLRWITWNPSGTGSRSALALDNINVTNGAIAPCVVPAAQPTTLNLTPTTTTITGSFTAAVPAPSNYLVVYSTLSTLSSQPVNGTSYTIGQTLGGGIVTQISSATTINITGLTSASQYYVFVYSYNNNACSGGPAYLTTAPLTGTITTSTIPNCVAPVAAPTSLILTPSTTSINGSFTASGSANNYLVVRSTSATLSATPVNGTTYTAGQAFGGGTVVIYGSSTSFVSAGLTPGTLYYYFIFSASGSCTGQPVYFGTSLNGSATTTNNPTPTNYYNAANNLSCYPLKTSLYNIISTGTTVLSYTPGVWNAFLTTDMTRNFENTADIINDMYSNRGPGLNEPYEYTYGVNQCGNYNAEGQCYNREHSTPQSWFAQASPMVSDIHHIVPTDGFVNNKRSNFPFGTVGTTIYTSQNGSKQGTCIDPGFTGQVFEPINEFKGDFARMQLYMAVRYENVIAGWVSNSNAADVLNGTSNQVYKDWYIKLLYSWHVQDPVSAKEIARNNAVFALQGNRNPFIDSPQYVLKIWNCTGLLAPIVVAPPTPTILNVSNKCFNAPTDRGKLSNPPATGVVVKLDGTVIPYNTADSSFAYFTSATTTVGNHTVNVTYTNGAGTTMRDSIYAVLANVTPTNSIAGTTTVTTGTATTISTTTTNAGTTPTYIWQDSTSAAGWVTIAGATASSLSYTPAATGHKLRCIVTSNAACASPAQVTSNVVTFTVNPLVVAPPTPTILNVSNKCFNAPTARGKLSNPPVTGVVVKLDGTVIPYNTADSSFAYFTSATTTVGNHTVNVTYANGAGTTMRDSIYAVLANVTPTNSIAGTTTVTTGTATTISTTTTNAGTTPTYIWQDSTSAAGWVTIAGATASSHSYTPAATGHKLRCIVTSNATCASPTQVTSNVVTFTVTALVNVPSVNFGIKLYPNPVSGNNLNLYNLSLTDKWLTAEVIQADGKHKIMITDVQGKTQVNIYIGKLQRGTYTIKLVRATGGNAILRFVKL